MAGADLEAKNMNPRACPHCGAIYQTASKTVVCPCIGKRVRLVEVADYVDKQVEVIDVEYETYRNRVRGFLAAVKGGDDATI